ncbi:GNAT family N-acetyltransferase [Paenibacillus aurantius]|uniref:GNAT family N-acetyltransferase n=1 Tax=Paenibacillus aurantius TaxID=2918900 RepID=A0AA96LFA7_9BACL|nr:GNAT family N-acetyltransferase [Paenibacillus aurantius]WNQ10562.1 GNAT family N-acetyltransferase [Paenibacillus aurantius]
MIREAVKEDAREVARLSSQLGYEITEFEAGERLERLLADRDHAVYVQEAEGGGLAGWVHVHGRHLIESPPFAEIGGLVVDGTQRRKRVGEQLMRRSEQWARESGYRMMRIRSGSQRKEAHEFYQRIGYEAVKRQEVFALSL